MTRSVKLAWAALISAFLFFAIAPAALAAPQGPWVLPASNISATGQQAASPQVTTAADGTTTAVWSRSNGSEFIIQAATRPPGGSYGAPVDLSASGQNAHTPEITTDQDGITTVVWRRFNGSENIIQAATRPAGGSFGTPEDLSTPDVNSYNPQITTAPDGTTTAVWSSTNGSDYIVQESTRPPGGSFGAAVDLPVTGGDGYDVQIATAPDGTTTAAWTRVKGANYVVQASTRPPGGSFGTAVDLSAGGQDAYTPQITASPDGSVTAAWYRLDGSYYVVQASTRPPGGSFGTPVDLSAGGQDSYAQQITTAPDGTVTVVWSQPTESEVSVQASTRPPGGSFGTPVALSASGQTTYEPQITTTKDGTTTAVWQGHDGAGNYIIQGSTRPPGGSFGTPVDLSASGQIAYDAQVSPAPNGSISAVWILNGETPNNIIQGASTVQPTFLLGVEKSGTGSGRVTSAPAGIDCGDECQKAFDEGKVVTLTAAPDEGSEFSGWGGVCASATNGATCDVTVDEAKLATANFDLLPETQFPLTVEKSGLGSGNGKVTSAPAGIDCDSSCEDTFDADAVVVLTATPAAGSTFGGWGGTCASQLLEPTCTVTMDRARQASFIMNLNGETPVFPLTVEKSGSGAGMVSSAPAGIDCGSDCEKAFDEGTVVTLRAVPGIGSVFSTWGGACRSAGKSAKCDVKVDQAKFAIANFEVDTAVPSSTRLLTVAVVGQGSGAVASSPAGISCGIDCEEPYAKDTVVTLTATPATGSMFVGWSGACAAAAEATTCQVTMDEARSVTANFTPEPTETTTVFDGKFIYIRLKCGARFKPGCKGFAQAMTKKPKYKKVKVKKHGKVKRVKKIVKPKPKAMTARGNAAQKAKKWKIAKLRVKPAYRGKIAKMATQPTKKLLKVKLVVRAKKYKKNKKITAWHKYRVRTAQS